MSFCEVLGRSCCNCNPRAWRGAGPSAGACGTAWKTPAARVFADPLPTSWHQRKWVLGDGTHLRLSRPFRSSQQGVGVQGAYPWAVLGTRERQAEGRKRPERGHCLPAEGPPLHGRPQAGYNPRRCRFSVISVAGTMSRQSGFTVSLWSEIPV